MSGMIAVSLILTSIGVSLTDFIKVHKRGFQEWDVEEIMSLKRDAPAVQGRDLELEARNLSPRCQAVFNCLKDTGDAVLSGALGAYFQIAAYAANGTPGKDLMTFLNQPFVANAAGVAVAGVISGQINEATKKECSTSGSQEDVLNAAVSAAIAKAPTSGAISVTVNGPSGSWSIDVHAKPEGQNPVPQCFEA